jgi:FkbM family methyltransferase
MPIGEQPSTSLRARPQPAAQARTDLPRPAWRIAGALSRADRARLAWQLLADEAEEITFRREGTRWTAFPWDRFISEQLFVDGGFQVAEVRSVLAWMRRHHRFATPKDVVIDVGANIGTSTIPFAKETDSWVLAIEPVPEVFAVLCRNVADNGLAEQVTCIQAAISPAGVDRVRMILPEGNSGGGSVCRQDRKLSFAGVSGIRGIVEVPAMTLAEVINAHGVAPERVAFVWSDTQGCEADVIEPGQALWAAGVPLFVEFAPQTFPDGAEALVAAATTLFSGFIAAKTLLTDVAAEARPITGLAAFCRALGPSGGDALLLPEGFEI